MKIETKMTHMHEVGNVLLLVYTLLSFAHIYFFWYDRWEINTGPMMTVSHQEQLGNQYKLLLILRE